MSEQRFESPYLRLASAAATPGEDLRGPFVSLTSSRTGLSCRLHPDEYDLARLFDGEHTAAQRLELARQRFNPDISALELDQFSHLLADAGLLFAGADEPIPVPAQTDAEAQRMGSHRLDPEHEQAFPPSTSPGSLSGPSQSGPIAGSPMRPRDEAERIDFPLPARLGLWLGRLFCWPLYLPGGMWLLLLLTAALLSGLWVDQVAAAADVQRLLVWQNLIYVGVPAAVLTNLTTQLARAAAIFRETGEHPAFGIQLLAGIVPRFITDTEGAAERVARPARIRIVAASISASLGLFCLLVLGWYLVRQTTTILPAALITAALFGLANALLRINPLARTDGYYWLTQKLGIADLREQAVLAVLGRRERWGNRAPPPTGPVLLYAALSLAFLLAVLGLILGFPARWLESNYGGAGVALFLAAIAVLFTNLRRQFADRRGQIGGLPLRSRLARSAREWRRRWLIFVVVAVVSLWPYTYEPGGRFSIQPLQRADVPAQIAGAIVDVPVTEGDWVEADALIAQIDDELIRSQMRSAQARVAQIEAELARARNGATQQEIDLASQQVATATARLSYSDAEAQRARTAQDRGAITSQERDRAQAQADVHREELAEAQSQLALVQSPTRVEEIAALEAELAREQAQLDGYTEQFEHTRIRAPIAGYVVSETLRFAKGRFVEPGEVIAQLENSRQLQAQILLPEFAARHVQPGARTTIKAWMAPTGAYAGTVVAVAPSAEVGENGRVVRVLVDIEQADESLRAEMSGQAKITAGTEPTLVAFSRAFIRFLLIEVWSWLP